MEILSESSDILAASFLSPITIFGGDSRNDGDGQGRYKCRRNIEQSLCLAVNTVEHLCFVIGKARCVLKSCHAKAGVKQIDKRQDDRAESNGYADPDKVFEYLSPRLGDIGLGNGNDLVVANLIHIHVYKHRQRADGNAEDGSGRGNGLIVAVCDKIPRQQKADNDLDEHLEHLTHGRGYHVSVSLRIAPERRGEAHQKHRRCKHAYAQCGVGIMQDTGKPIRKQEHYRRADCA